MSIVLNMKSDYSFLSSTITFYDAILFAKKNHLKQLSLFDRNLHGALEFYDCCIFNNIQPLIGLEANVLYNEQSFPLYFLAKNENGYKNISKILSIANSFNDKRIPLKNLSLYSSDIALIISTEDSYLSYLIEQNNFFAANLFIEDLKNIFKDIYLGVYRYKNANNEKILLLKEFSSNLQIKAIAFQYAMHKDEKDTIILNLLNCIKNNENANKSFLDIPAICEAYLKNDELLKIYYDKDELDNLDRLVDNIHLKLNKISFSLPEVYKNEDSDEKLRQLSFASLKEKKLAENDTYLSRVEYELKVIKDKGFSNYYLVVADYVNYARNNDIPVGPSRGSGGASLIAYLLNITTIDPIKYDLLFERFLNPYRSNYPDFDVDFADSSRDLIINYVKEKYGYNHVAYISTFATFGIKSAIRDLARVFKMSGDDVDYILKSISNNATSINNEYKNNEKFRNLLDIHSDFKRVCTFASQIEGLKKQSGIHAAGIILSKERIDDYLPCNYIDEKSLIIQYDYQHAEKIGLIKMDFLSLKNLTIIDYCFKKINARYHKDYNISNFKFDYKEAYDLISSTQTLGLFQLESEGINQVIKQMQPSCFDDVVALIALYRPGPMQMINTYIERKNGQEVVYIDENVKDILKQTYGIIIYQEQIMQICQKVASYSLAEADILRRAISKKNAQLIANEKKRFIQGCINNNIEEQKASKLFSYIEKFADYGFNKAHSVGYATITTMMSYIKAIYPTIFYEALLNINQENGTKFQKIMMEAKKRNIKILLPSVLTSFYYFTSEDDCLQFGLCNIKSIKENVAKVIIDERNIAPYGDIYDFIIRMTINDISLNTLYDLCSSGALDCFNISRKKILANLSLLYNNALLYKGLNYKANAYKEKEFMQVIQPPILFFEDETIDILKLEFEALGIYVSIHPFSSIKQNNKNITNIIDIEEEGFYDIIAQIKQILLKKGKEKNYILLQLCDDTSSIKVYCYQNIDKIIQEFHENDIVNVKIAYKNNRYYLNFMEIRKEA